MPHRQFSAPSVRPTHSYRTPAATPTCRTIHLPAHSRRLLIGLPACTAHSGRTPAAPPAYPLSVCPHIRAACLSPVCTPHPHRLLACPPLCLRHHLPTYPPAPLSSSAHPAAPLACPPFVRAVYPLVRLPRLPPRLRSYTQNFHKHSATDTHPAEITDKYLFLRPEYNYL